MLAALFLHALQAAAEQEQLFEHHAPPRARDLLYTLGAVDGNQRVPQAGKAIFRQQPARQELGVFPGDGVERGVGDAKQVFLGNARRQRVDGHNAAVLAGDGFHIVGGNQLAAPPVSLHRAAKQVFFPHAEQGGIIAVVKIGDVHRAAVVKNGEFGQFHALADTAQLGRGADYRADTGAFPLAKFSNRGDVCAVVIVARIEFERVLQGADAQLFEQRRFPRADAGNGARGV